MSTSTASGSMTSSVDPKTDPKRKAKSRDPGWKYGYWPDVKDKNTVECILCGKKCRGGIKRLKEHLVGGYKDIGKCSKTTTAISQEMHKQLTSSKRAKVATDDYDDVEVQDHNEHESGANEGSNTVTHASSGTTSKRKVVNVPQVRGPMDKLVRRTPEQVVDERRSKGLNQTTIENHFRTKEEREVVNLHVADWWYEAGVPFNAAKKRTFEIMCESIAQYGPGYKPPSYHELRTSLLEKSKNKTENMRETFEAYWKLHGCTLMSDGWSDRKHRHLINFLVNCPEGTYFLGSVDASKHIQDKDLMFRLLDEKIREIGADNVVQVVTDNASTYKAAGKMLMEKYPKLFWTPCAAHCIDLMLEDIGKLKQYSGVISEARMITTFIYKHTRLLDAMRACTGGKDLVKFAATRFATAFLTLQSLYKFKDNLRELFLSDDWKKSRLVRTEKGKKVEDTIFSVYFWNGVEDSLRAGQPLLVALRIVDSDELPATPEVIVAMNHAKKMIKKNFDNKERLYKKVIDIVEQRWETQMGQQLHKAALFLNPSKYFDFATDNDTKDQVWKINEAFQDVIDKLVPDQETNDKILRQALLYKTSREGFAKMQATTQRDKMNPIDWWSMYGGQAKELAKFAIRILGLCASASGCERCWSTFEFIHTKKRNRLEHQHLNDLVFVQYNRRLEARFRERREKNRNFDPLVLEEFDWSSEWMVEGNTNLVHPEDNDGLNWHDVDIAMGALESLAGRNLPRSAHASSSRATQQYARKGKNVVSIDEDDDEEDEVEEVPNDDEPMQDEEVPNDDDDIDDDFGLDTPNREGNRATSRSRPATFSLLDDYDD